jgi:hypothetical protein
MSIIIWNYSDSVFFSLILFMNILAFFDDEFLFVCVCLRCFGLSLIQHNRKCIISNNNKDIVIVF